MDGDDHKTAIAVLNTKLEAQVETSAKSERDLKDIIRGQSEKIEKLESTGKWNMRAALATASGLAIQFLRGGGNA